MKLRKTVINLTRGVPPVDVFPVEDLIACQEAALRRDAEVLLQYSHAGYLPLRAWLGQQYAVGPEQVLTGNSSMEIFSFIAEVLVPNGARAFVESPSYDRAITALRRTGAEDGARFLRIPFCSLTEAEIEEGVSRLARLL
jgi:2-aminoadipate transaminase